MSAKITKKPAAKSAKPKAVAEPRPSREEAEAAVRVLIDGARDDIEQVLASRRRLPSLSSPSPRLKAA